MLGNGQSSNTYVVEGDGTWPCQHILTSKAVLYCTVPVNVPLGISSFRPAWASVTQPLELIKKCQAHSGIAWRLSLDPSIPRVPPPPSFPLPSPLQARYSALIPQNFSLPEKKKTRFEVPPSTPPTTLPPTQLERQLLLPIPPIYAIRTHFVDSTPCLQKSGVSVSISLIHHLTNPARAEISGPSYTKCAKHPRGVANREIFTDEEDSGSSAPSSPKVSAAAAAARRKFDDEEDDSDVRFPDLARHQSPAYALWNCRD